MKKKKNVSEARKKITREIAAESSKELTAELPESEQIVFLPFLVGQEWYALEVGFLKEVIKPAPITLVPETPEFLVGVINLRGEIVSVFDLVSYFNQGSSRETFTRILIVNHLNSYYGILSDSNVEVSRIPQKILQSPLSMVDAEKRDSIKGIFSHQGNMVSLLDVPGIFFSARMNSVNW